MYRGDCVVSIGLELRDVDCTNAVCLDRVDVDDEAVLRALNKSCFSHQLRHSLTSLFESSLATEDGAMTADEKKLLRYEVYRCGGSDGADAARNSDIGERSAREELKRSPRNLARASRR